MLNNKLLKEFTLTKKVKLYLNSFAKATSIKMYIFM